MHTIRIIIAGLLLLAAFIGIGRYLLGAMTPAKAAAYFVPVWLAASIVNLWVGVSRAGYTITEELPIMLIVFGVPALVAAGVWWATSRG
jgi:hypothetical protein